MGWFSGKTIPDTIKAVGDLYTTDKARIEAETKLQEALHDASVQQLNNNKLLIVTKRIFNSGWIPLIGWSAGFLILLFYAPQILIITYVWGKSCIALGKCTAFPMKPDDILNLVYLLFGMGGLNIFKNNQS